MILPEWRRLLEEVEAGRYLDAFSAAGSPAGCLIGERARLEKGNDQWELEDLTDRAREIFRTARYAMVACENAGSAAPLRRLVKEVEAMPTVWRETA